MKSNRKTARLKDKVTIAQEETKLCLVTLTPIKQQVSFASVIGRRYNTFLLCPRPITLAKRYLRFYRCHAPDMFDKTSKVKVSN